MKHVREFLDQIRRDCPNEMLAIKRDVYPAEFEATAILQRLEDVGRFPMVLFENPRNVKGDKSGFALLTNIFASRRRCAIALGASPERFNVDLSLAYARRESHPIAPSIISKELSPVKENIDVGSHVDLNFLPIVRHHEMDPGPYLDMTPVMKDPDDGFYNIAFLRNMYKGSRKLGVAMAPMHCWRIFKEYEARGQPTPTVIVLGHHPAFYLGSLSLMPWGNDDYATIGGFMQEPLRLTESETWGKDFMIPADAEMVIEGEIPPETLEVEAPFGEYTGYYGPQKLAPIINVTAVNYRNNAIINDVFVGHRDNWILGGLPKEGSLYNLIKGEIPSVKAVHLPPSGCGRFNCYISLENRVEGDSVNAAMLALGWCHFVKMIIVVDDDIDVFNEQQVMWAVATRVQADKSINIVTGAKGNILDPSLREGIKSSKLIIDATKPKDRPFADILNVPASALERVNIDEIIAS